MRDPDSIAIHQRLLILRQVPGFAETDLSELASIAENLIETAFEPGDVVSAPPSRVSAIHVIVSGMLASGTAHWGPLRLFGAFEVIAGRGVPRPVIALMPTRTLRLAASDFAEVLEDNYSILSSARRVLASRLIEVSRTGSWRSSRPVAGPRPELRLGLVDRLIALRQQMPFATARIQALAAIAHGADEVRVTEGTIVQDKGTYADAMWVVLAGVLRTIGPDARVYGPGESFGILEALGEVSHDTTVEALTSARLLRVPAIAVLDVMEDHTDFALGMISKLASELLDHVGVVDAEPPMVLEHVN